MNYNFIAKDLDDLQKRAEELVEIINNLENPVNMIIFKGSMGAGKTTFIKYICKELGVIDIVTSPTFALVNEYHTSYGEPVYHFDLYRINSIEELFDLGYEEYFYSSGLSMIEWPEKAEQIIPFDDPNMNIVVVTINVTERGVREICMSIQ